MNKGRLQWYNVGNEELQAGSYSEAVRIVNRRKAFEKRQKGKENETNK
jgi:outer membrane protein assembly factor BamD (BamD/ComL family)